jgi:hypothetical protein
MKNLFFRKKKEIGKNKNLNTKISNYFIFSLKFFFKLIYTEYNNF